VSEPIGTALVITVSTRAHAGVYADQSGPIIATTLGDTGFIVDGPQIVPDGKAVGWALRDGRLPLTDSALCVSGRLSFELVQKAARAGAPFLVGVGAPTSLAVSLAEAQGITLCGFARDGEVNVYSGAERVAPTARR